VVIMVSAMALTIQAGDKPAAEKAVKAPRVYGNYAKLQLTPEQTAKIAELQAATRVEVAKLQKAERDAVMELLNADQKAELAKLEVKPEKKMHEGDAKPAGAKAKGAPHDEGQE